MSPNDDPRSLDKMLSIIRESTDGDLQCAVEGFGALAATECTVGCTCVPCTVVFTMLNTLLTEQARREMH